MNSKNTDIDRIDRVVEVPPRHQMPVVACNQGSTCLRKIIDTQRLLSIGFLRKHSPHAIWFGQGSKIIDF